MLAAAILILSSTVLAFGKSGFSAFPDLHGRPVVSVTGNNYAPLNFVNPKTGKAMGWEYDAVNKIGRRLNCKIQWKVTSWDIMIAAIHNGRFNVGMDGITITNKRKKQVDFSIPYMVSRQFMLVRKNRNRLKAVSFWLPAVILIVSARSLVYCKQ